MNENDRYWWPDSFAGYYWPLPEKRETLECFTQLYVERFGYEFSDSREYEPGFEKVAIYTSPDGKPKHVARQVSSGKQHYIYVRTIFYFEDAPIKISQSQAKRSRSGACRRRLRAKARFATT